MALGGLLALAACSDPPTDIAAGTDLHSPVSPATSLPTASPLVTAECPAGTTTGSGALPGSGALYLICVPSAWNGSLVVYAHGFVNPFDPVVPYTQEALYAAKVQQAGAAAFLTQIPGQQLASPGGHCVFTLAEVQGAVALLLSQVAAQGLAVR